MTPLQYNTKMKVYDPESQFVYDEILGGIGFGDATRQSYRHYSVCVAGLREDGIRIILAGFSGAIEEVCEQSVMFKDTLLCKRFLIPSEPKIIIEKFKKTDGLTDYDKIPAPHSSREILKVPPEQWVNFRSENHLAILSGVPNWLRGKDNFQAAVQRLVEDLTFEKVDIPFGLWPMFDRAASPHGNLDREEDSALHAAVYALELLRNADIVTRPNQHSPWYRNPGG